MRPSIDQELKQLEQELSEPLRQAVMPPPSPAETGALIAALQPEFDVLRASQAKSLQFNTQVEEPSLWRLLRSQFLMNWKTLVLTGSAVFLMLILLVDPKRPLSSFVLADIVPTSLFPVITPLLLIACMLFSYRSWNPGMRAVESITPYPPALVLYSRMLMIMGLILSWALISSAIVGIRVTVAGEYHIPFIPFLLQWLGISLLIGGIAMYVLFRRGMRLGIICASTVYVMWFIFNEYFRFHQFKVEHGSALDGIMLLIGLVLLVRSYYRSKIIRSGAGGSNGAYDFD
ncbi:hypothetical protein M3201_20245 [Paenibacillus motobuensis]|uniref:hypothetical protein n=1 Tax=Paenibacillus TaxID=44249 RepID=UPI00203B28DC|nr:MULTISPECIES: hypothetical protein [Paenibacillus]MCM3042012.1 hypothetical protein [Paenibacillus lutimineralis]MCM3649116.1 hypothetical protein [Paenibacillus motobuensis]